MAQKKRGTNPIRITLTEEQISDIIQSAAKTRRGLKVESLEDRIAPSALGGPLVDPGFSDPGVPAPPPPIDNFAPTDVPPAPIDNFAPTDVPPAPIDNFASDVPPAPVDNFNVDTPPAPDGEAPYMPPAGDSGIPQPPAPPAPGAEGPGGPTPPGSGLFNDPADPTSGPSDPVPVPPSHDPAPSSPTPDATSGSMPSSQEIEEHRRNILRQLRGN